MRSVASTCESPPSVACANSCDGDGFVAHLIRRTTAFVNGEPAPSKTSTATYDFCLCSRPCARRSGSARRSRLDPRRLAPDAAAKMARGRILIVYADAATRENLQRMLQIDGYEAPEAASCRAAIQAFE